MTSFHARIFKPSSKENTNRMENEESFITTETPPALLPHLRSVKRRRGGEESQNTHYFFPRILNILVPHFGQVPVIALLVSPPFPFIETSFSSCISLFA